MDMFRDKPVLLHGGRVEADLLATLRDVHTEGGKQEYAFYRAASLLSDILVVRAANMFSPFTQKAIQTPLDAGVVTDVLVRDQLCFVSVERAGGVMLCVAQRWFPEATFGRIRLKREERPPFAPVDGHHELPDDLTGKTCFILDPMLATGGSASRAAALLKKRGAAQVVFVGFIGAPEGFTRLSSDHPDVPVILAELDERLDDRAYIVPGLGDAGDRLYGIVPKKEE